MVAESHLGGPFQTQYSPCLTISWTTNAGPVLTYASGFTVYTMPVGLFEPKTPPQRVRPSDYEKTGEVLIVPTERVFAEKANKVEVDNVEEIVWGCCTGMDGQMIVAVGDALHVWLEVEDEAS